MLKCRFQVSIFSSVIIFLVQFAFFDHCVYDQNKLFVHPGFRFEALSHDWFRKISDPTNFEGFPFTQHSSEDSYKSLANSMCVVLMFDSQSQSEPNSDPPTMNPWMVDG
jgi:hypothetical protein